MPNRLTYRWVEGLERWGPSVIGPGSWNASVQVEDQTAEVEAEARVQEVNDFPLSDQAVVDKDAEDRAALWQ